ncbi:MAG TPA: type VI secretion system-associated FHA domain protein TagH [Steroidobacteraceae bacterium]|nr:type VI secretion system-associated FHA domain protein TagH [Steroidobacteraceae bacterium]
MYLSLEVVSPQAASLGAERRRLVGASGLTIGRVPGNDWVIPDPYISKQHARITFANGAFLVEGLGRNPIAIGSPDNVIPSHQPRPLRGGDRLFIDQYEIRVSAVEGAAPAARPPIDDPFGIVDAAPAPPGSFSAAPPAAVPAAGPAALVPDSWESGPGGGSFSDTAELDPLNALGGRAAPVSEPPPVDWQRASPLKDHFEPPAPSRPAAASGIPDNWDRSVVTPRPAPAAARPAPAPSGIPDNWDRSVVAGVRPAPGQPAPVPHQAAARAIPGGEPRSPAPPAAAPPRPRMPLPPRQRPDPEAATPVVPAGMERAAAPAPAGRPGVSAGAGGPTASKPAPLPADLAELLRGAGLADRDLSPETLRELGQVLRIVVQGVMEVLQARAEIKSQFRLPLTRVQAKENNPLKLSPNVESALHTLLVQRNPGYLPTVQAFEDAFADIRSHQMAMLEGLRVAFESMLKSFDPKGLEEEFEKSAGRGGLLGFGGRAKHWDLYVERFARLGTDPDDIFRRLFGDVFAEAYERQLERLKSLRV